MPPDDLDWNPWGQEFEHENQKLPAFERPHLILDPEPEKAVNHGKAPPPDGDAGQTDTSGHVVEIWGKAAIGE